MVKLTIVGRVSDGLPLAQGTRYVNEESGNPSTYQQQAEFILSEISRGALQQHSRMIIGINDLHCFSYIIENGICFMTLTDSSYPKKLVFFFLQDLAKELFDKFDQRLVEKITKPYSFVKLGGIIGNIRRQYVDTRTQANLSKLNAKCDQDSAKIVTEEFSQLVKRRNRYEMLQKITRPSDHVPHFRDSKTLEIIAMKWTPITILFMVAATLFLARLSIKDHDFMMAYGS